MSGLIYVSTRKGLFVIRRRGSGDYAIDRTHFLGDPSPLVMCDRRDGRVYAALQHGHFGAKLHRSEDGGKTFEECAVPAYPERPAGAEDVDNVSKKDVPWSLKLVWAMAEAGGAGAAGDLWCGTIPGGLFRSRDGGDSWELNRPLWDHPGRAEWFGGGADLPGVHSVIVDPRDPKRVIAGVSVGGVWTSEDDGASWSCESTGMRAAFMPPDRQYEPGVQDPHQLAVCRDHPDTIWVQHHNGIFLSRDGARSWTEIEDVSPSSFGFGVAVHPSEPDTAWFVPAIKDEQRVPVDGRLVVTRTRDGGRSFETLSNGLPDEPAYDLVYRHALDVDDEGRCLAFGSTTGGLWVSEDQGDRWTLVSAYLPPIACVRFAPSMA